VSWGRTRWLALLAAAIAAGGGWWLWRWPSAGPALDCPVHQVGWVEAEEGSHAACNAPAGTPLPAGATLTVGGRLDLNSASAADLALIPGVGPSVAQALIDARGARGGFASWEDVDAVPGVGPARMEALQAATELRP
jgi:competence protein ComEA